MKRTLLSGIILIFCLSLCGCAEKTAPAAESSQPQELSAEDVYSDAHEMEELLPREAEVLADAPAPEPVLLDVEASGVLTYENPETFIDYSNTGDGYIMVKYTGSTEQKLKVRIFGPSTTYTYNLWPGDWEAFPLSDGNGSYSITVYCGTGGNKYASMLELDFEVELTDEFAPYIRPNQYVDYMVAPNTIAMGKELVSGITGTLDKVAAIYDYVVDNFSYDDYKAANVKSGYLPVLDEVLAEKKGICFDYAAVMAGMLRSQGIPCKLIVGYAGSTYHAWINVWTEEFGWIDGVIYFNGTTWHRMDPTFASTANRDDYIMEFIANDYNYTTKYSY